MIINDSVTQINEYNKLFLNSCLHLRFCALSVLFDSTKHRKLHSGYPDIPL